MCDRLRWNSRLPWYEHHQSAFLHLITSANSDGGLPLDCQVLDSRGEELRDVDQKYECLTPPPEHLTVNLVPEYDLTSVGEEEHFQTRHIIMAITDWQVWLHILLFWSITTPRKSPFPANSSRRLNIDTWVSLRDIALPALDHPRVWILGCCFKPSHRPPIRLRE